MALAFGPFLLDPERRELRAAGEVVPLTPKAWETLWVLAEARGERVGKEELLRSVWRDSFVEQAVLTQNVYTLRKALSAHGGRREWIETVPRRGYRFTVPVEPAAAAPAAASMGAPGSATAPVVGSVAILPLLPLAGTGETLGLAMADALITRLSRLEPLEVRPTSAIQELGEAGRDPFAIGRRLGVDAVMDGSLQQVGGRLRVTVRLLRVADRRTLWADRFDAVFTDFFAVQDTIAEQVAAALPLELGSGEGRPALRRATADPVAYQEYVRGRYFWNRRTGDDLRTAIEHFQRAIQLDPRFAAPWSGLADCWGVLPHYSSTLPREAFPQALAAAEEALRLDPQLAEGHTSLAYARLMYLWDWAGAESAFLQALHLQPRYSTASHWYAYCLTATGRHEEAVERAREARRVDPLSLVINADLGLVLHLARRTGEAIDQLRSTLELDARFPYAYFGLALAASEGGEAEEAVAAARRAVELSAGSSVMLGVLGHVLGRGGRVAEARSVLRELEQRAATRPVQAAAFALVHLGLGDLAGALDGLEEAYRERSRFLLFLRVWSIYDSLREEPRFVDLVRRVGQPAPVGA